MNVNMYFCSNSSVILILCFFITITAATHNPPYLTGDISISCGSTETSAALDGREWIGDEHSKISSSLQIKGSSTSSTISTGLVPYKTARTSRSRFSYAFQLNPGHKLIRLHFNPFSYRGSKGFKDFFTVEAGSFTLLGNFSASLTAVALGVNYVAKEFCISIEENKPFNIIFTPEQSIQSQDGTYAFINGIEIISMPLHLSYFHNGNLGVQVVGLKSFVHIDNNTALEIIHRQNIKLSDDFLNMFEMRATVPKQNPNKINNVIWKISVDVGFRYLVRIHFCEQGLKMAETGHVIYEIFINEIIANTNIDLVKERNDNDILWHRDYMVMIQGHKQEGKRHLLISLQSTDEFMDINGPLKGFEVLKLNNPDNSLAGPNPLPPALGSPSQTLSILAVFSDRNTIANVAITMIALVNIVVYKLRQIREDNSEEEKKPLARAQRLCRRFALAEILLATENFNSAHVIGKGGFGNVYKGLIDNGQDTVAIKRLNFNSKQGAHEFWTEIETLSELRHLNLVSLIGYCNELGEMILVYEYMTCGTMAGHLYKISDDNSNSSSLSWTQLLNICIGAGRGLDFLHTGHGIIHRDVKASNILLDENFVAKVSDFGLAKLEKRSQLQSHISTNVKGTYGYLDPYYFETGKLTRKSDTYAFGVVLLEVLCGRPAVDLSVEEDKRSLTMWARENISKGELEQIISSNLREEISPDSLKAFVRVTESCLDGEPKKRPTMAQVVLQLEFSLEQQENPNSLVPNEISFADVLPFTDETILSASTEKLTTTSTDEQNFTSLLKEQTNMQMVNAEPPSIDRDARRTTMQKQLGKFWPAGVFWKHAKPSAKEDLEVSISEDQVTNMKLTEFDWVTIEVATNKFSDSNMIGSVQGVNFYKVVLRSGLAVAVKRISCSKYGQKMFKSEIALLSKLQHPNIMKLLGYFIDGEAMILVYEFMESTSLETVLFERSCHLPWMLRFKIIMGIARGVLCLHQDLWSRILYSHLKPCNIFLDTEMNPKISFNFGHKDDTSTNPVFSINNYATPESCSSDLISLTSDIYIFGIIVLEIVSGRRHSLAVQNQDIITQAWKLWNEDRELDLVDALMEKEFSKKEALRCIQISLLCTQTQPQYRPAMPIVLKALQGNHQNLQWELRQVAIRK